MSRFRLHHSGWFAIALSTLGLLSAPGGLCQSITPAIDGTNTIVTSDGNRFDIWGGTLSGNGSNLFHSFDRFGLNRGEVANFLSNPTIQNIVGRVSGGDPSVINGLIQVAGGNSNLFLLNPSGILFGPDARLNVPASFTATTANGIQFGDTWFSALGSNDYQALVGTPTGFAFTTNAPGRIINSGNLTVAAGQNLTLLGGIVINTGQLAAPGGQLVIAAVPGEKLVRLSQPGNPLSLEIQPLSASPTQPQAWNLPIATLPQLLTGGNLGHATGLVANADGTVTLTRSGTKVPTTPGTAIVSGTLDVSSSQTGGIVAVLGDRVGIVDATINASGNTGGGKVLIGGDYQGKGSLPTAAQTYINPNTFINASALSTGNGGRVIVWADDSTRFFGNISARGGDQSGDGGFVEVSGKQNLAFRGAVDTTASNGKLGTLLLDPTNITIVNGGEAANDSEISGDVETPGDGQIFQADGGSTDFTISEQSLERLSGGTNVILEASNNITINDLSDNELTFAPGTGTIRFTADADNNGAGSFSMNAGNTIRAEGRNISISGASITAGTINTAVEDSESNRLNGGAISLRARGNITTGNLNTRSSNGNGGAIALNAGSDIRVGSINSNSGDTAGSATLISSQGSISTGGIDLGSNAGSGATLTLQANQDVNINGTLFVDSGSQDAGQISVTSETGSINAGSSQLIAAATTRFGLSGTPQGRGGTLNLSAANNITAGSLSTFSEASNGGNVSLTTSRGNIQVQFIDAQALGSGIGGNVSINAGSLFQATGTFNDRNTISASISTAGGANGGAITIQHGGGSTGVPFTVGNASQNGTAGAITTGASNTIAPTQSFPGNYTQGTAPSEIRIMTSTPTPLTTEPTPTPPTTEPTPTPPTSEPTPTSRNRSPLPPDQESEIGNTLSQVSTTQSQIQVAAAPADAAPATPTVGQDPSVIAAAASMEAADQQFSEEYESYLELPESPSPKTLQDAQIILQDVGQATGAKPALIYVSFASAKGVNPSDTSRNKNSKGALLQVFQDTDPLEVILVTPQGNPIRKRLPQATRKQVLQTARKFRLETSDPRKTRSTSYLLPAQQLYQWLIAPLKPELNSRGVNNLTFVLDVGLRTIPLPALHDGQTFLIEKYSVGLMPSLSLTDTRRSDFKTARVLGLGISESTQGQAPLPAVPVELKTIVGELWSGQSFLNQQTTLETLKTVRQQRPFSILHLATHGEFQPGPLGNSYIQFWDQRLKLNQIRQLGLSNPPVELLTLSACRTAVGDEQAELGFAGMAVQSGVKTVVASLWQVNDTATAALMTAFYDALKTAPTKAKALQQAQIKLARGKVTIEQDRLRGLAFTEAPPVLEVSAQPADQQLSHPYYWSAFTMVGNPW
jgi:filamentous hemagglutinin family protein